MKKTLIKLSLLVAVLFVISLSASAQIYVKIRPTFPVVVRTEQPSRDYVWVDEEWENRGGTYVYAGGHWAPPPHRGYVRRSGHWQHDRRGNIWIRGTWRRR